MICSMDPVDAQILSVLQADGRITNAELAERVRLSPSPCLRRVRRLERDGVISGYHATLDRRRVGLGVTVFVELKVDGHSAEVTEQIERALADVPEVVAAHIVSGPADFLLEVVVADLDHYERLLIGRLLTLPNVSDVRSNFALRTIKSGAPLPVGPG
jgi:Lrp/AsnC family leucine-responsive transcriptional regulator